MISISNAGKSLGPMILSLVSVGNIVENKFSRRQYLIIVQAARDSDRIYMQSVCAINQLQFDGLEQAVARRCSVRYLSHWLRLHLCVLSVVAWAVTVLCSPHHDRSSITIISNGRLALSIVHRAAVKRTTYTLRCFSRVPRSLTASGTTAVTARDSWLKTILKNSRSQPCMLINSLNFWDLFRHVARLRRLGRPKF